MLHDSQSFNSVTAFSVIIDPWRTFTKCLFFPLCTLSINHCTSVGYSKVGCHPGAEERMVCLADMDIHKHFHRYLSINLDHCCGGCSNDEYSGVLNGRQCSRTAPYTFIS